MLRPDTPSDLAATVLAGALAALAFARSAGAQCGAWTPGFHTVGTNQSVVALCAADLGAGPRLFAGGAFTIAGPVGANAIAAFDGTEWSAFLAGAANGANNRVDALVEFDDGSGPALWAAGNFTEIGGVFTPGVAKWNGTTWSALSSTTNNEVLCLAVFDDGGGPALYAGGDFTTIGGVVAAHIARWTGTAWAPVGGGTSHTVHALHVYDDGIGPALYVGGVFTTVGGLAITGLARWNGTSWSAPAPGLAGAVHAMATTTEAGVSKLVIGGTFNGVAGVLAARVARFDGTTWAALGSGVNGKVRALHVHDDGNGPVLFAGGEFNQAGGGQARFLARWNGSTWNEPGGGANSYVDAFTSWDDGTGSRLVVGGGFGEVGGVTVNHVAAWDGKLWTPVGEHGSGVSSTVHSLAVLPQPDGPVLCVAGRFASAGGAPLPRAARWNGTSWSPLGAGLVANLFSSADALEVLDLGNGPELYSGGALYSGTTVHRWNGTAWDPLGSLAMLVKDFAVFDDGAGPALYAALFTGQFSAQVLQRWNGTSWGTFPGGGLTGNWRANALHVHDDGTGPALFVGGFFFNIGTPSVSAWDVARWNGTSWSAVGGANELDGEVRALFSHDDGLGGGTQLYAGGTFGGAVKRWNGTSWSLVGGGMAPYAPVDDFEAFDDGTGPALYATGQLNPVNGSPPGIARWNGVSWSGVGTGFRTFGYSLAVYDDGQGEGPALFAGGAIDRAGDVAAASLARWRGCRVATFCTGDGLDPAVTTPCPCGNTGAAGRGCAWGASFPGALLELSGRIDPDTLVLRGSAMPGTTTAIYLKGDAVASAGIVFGDGVRCADGNLIRMTIVQNQGGASQYPGAGQLSLSVRGGTPPGSGLTAWYQTYFRSASPTFCPPATFNVTNGIRVAW